MPSPHRHTCTPAPRAHTFTNSHASPQPAATVPLGTGESDSQQDSKWLSASSLYLLAAALDAESSPVEQRPGEQGPL